MRNPALRLVAFALSFTAACGGETVEPGEPLAPPSREGWAPTAAWPGFTLVAPLESSRVHLVDMSGTAVHTWQTSGEGTAVYLTKRGTLLRTLKVKDHEIFRAGGQLGRLEELDHDGTVLWTFEWDSETGLSHHDVEELPNGNLLMIAWDRKTRAEALERGRDPALLAGDEFWPGAVYEIRPTRPAGGEVVWSWHAWDHLLQDRDPAKPNHGDPARSPERIDINGDRDPEPPSEEEVAAEVAQMEALGYLGDDDDDEPAAEVAGGIHPVIPPKEGEKPDEEEDPEEAAFKKRVEGADWMHANGIDYNAELDQIAISVRRFDEIWILDHSTTTAEAAGSTGGRSGKGGDLLYRWGNPFAYGMGEWEERDLLGQHNVQWIPEGYLGAGNLLAFNNGARPRDHSSVDEWWAPRDAAGHYLREEGRPFGPAEPVWSYSSDPPEEFRSSFISGVQRLPNGNTLICSGAQGWVFEVTPEGEVVWDWKSPYTRTPDEGEGGDGDVPKTALFRAERYGPDDPGIRALRERGAVFPEDPGPGPATNQLVMTGEDVEDEG